MTHLLSGNNAANVTLFENEDLVVDQLAMEQHINFLFRTGNINGIVAFGLNGEGYALNPDQVRDVLKVIRKVKQVHPQKKTLVGIMQPDADSIFQEAHNLLDDNIDGILLAPPLEEDCNNYQILNIFRVVSKITNKPLIAYNTGMSPFNFNMNILLRLSGDLEEEFIGIKNSKNPALLNEYVARNSTSRVPFQYIEGNDRQLATTLQTLNQLKQSGTYNHPLANISGSSNFSFFAKVIAREYAQVCANSDQLNIIGTYLDTHLAEALKNVSKYSDGNGYCGEPAVWKALLPLDGIRARPYVWEPLKPVEKSEIARLQQWHRTVQE